MKNTNDKITSQDPKELDANLYKDESNAFIDEIKKNYHFEKILNSALPEMIENETKEELIEGLTKHLAFTNEHLVRLKEVLCSIGETEIVKKHEAVYGKDIIVNDDNTTTNHLK